MNGKANYKDLFSGVNTKVVLENGECVIPINFDNAATTPPFKSVSESVFKNILMYGSIGRGKGHKSEYCTEVYEEARNYILDFFNITSKGDYSAIYVKNTTEGINMLSKSLVKSSEYKVLSTRMEHHANDIPWRYSCKVEYVDVNENGEIEINDIENALKKANGSIKLVSITGASNVTGFINDINKIAEISHKYGAKIVVDAAQLVAHRKINIEGKKGDDNIDFLVFSSHKMYSPFGIGVVIGKKKYLDSSNILIYGGGAVEGVTDDKVYFSDSPARHEAGTPNFLGVVALVEAMKSILSIGFENIKKHEDDLKNYMLKALSEIDRIVLYGNSNKEKLGVIPFNIIEMEDDVVAKKLADYRAIAVRHGGFCAHTYVRRLLNISNENAENYIINNLPQPGMVRISFGLYNTKEEIDDFIKVIKEIIKENI